MITFNNITPLKPNIFVAKPNMTIISKISEAYDIRYDEKLTELSELTFSMPFRLDNYLDIMDNENIGMVKEKYLLKLVLGEKVEWFVIDKISDSSDDSDIKNIHAFSLGYELADKNIREFKTESENATTTLTQILSDTIWGIDYVDASFDTRYRSVEISSSTVLDALIQVAETFNALIIWNTANRKLSFYISENIGQDKGMTFSYRKYLQSISQDTDTDEMVTRLKVYGKDGLTFADSNPTGTNYIEDFSYFMYPFEQKDLGVDASKLKGASVYFDVLDNYTKVISDIGVLNLNNITIPIIVEFANGTSSTMAINNTHKNKAITLIQEIKKVYSDIKIIIEPYPLVLDGTPETELNPSDINSFFWNWKTVILEEITDIANTHNAYGVYISSNLQQIEYATGYWQDVISFVKGKFSGQVLYRTNFWTTATWSQETIDNYNAKLDNILFQDVDIISVSAYFELNEDNVSTVSQLESDLHGTRKYGRNQNVYQEVKNFFDRYGKKIFFGELGFASRELASSEPWNNYPSTVDSEDAQANLFQAYKNVFGSESWCIGFSVFAITNGSTYDVVGKKAEKVISSWYANKVVVRESDYMRAELCQAIINYNELLESKSTEFTGLLTQLDALQVEMTTLKNTLNTLNNEMAIIDNSLEIAKSLNDTATIIAKQTEKANKQTQINSQTTLVNNKQIQIDNVEDDITDLRNAISIENNFSADLIKERNYFIIEKEWTDDRITKSDELLKMAKERMKEIRTPKISASLDVINFLEMSENYEDWDRLSIGDTVRAKHDMSKIDLKARVTEISYNFEDKSISLTISNAKKTQDRAEMMMNLLYQGASTSTTINMNKYKWDETTNIRTELDEWFSGEFDATKQTILAGTENSVEIGKRGIIIRNPQSPLDMLVINSSVLAISNDGGNTYKQAITTKGVIAERVAGKLLVGVNLSMENESGKFKFDKDGVTIDGASLTITGGIKENHLDPALKVMKIDNTYSNGIRIDSTNGIVVTKSNNKTKAILNATEGLIISKSTNGVDWTNVLYADTDGNLNITGNINMNGGNINWGAITKPTYSASEVGAVGNTQSAVFNTLTNNGTIGGLFMSGGQLYINASYINAGSISADRISGGTITGVNINGGNVSTIPSTGGYNIDLWSDVITFKQNGTQKGLIGQNFGYLYFSATGLSGFYFDGNIYGTGNLSISTISVTGSITVGGSTLATQSYVSSNYATFSWVQSQGYMTSPSLPYSGSMGGSLSVGGSFSVSSRSDFYNNVYMYYALTVDGKINGTTVGSSDIRLKKNINQYTDNALSNVLNTPVYTYHYKRESDDEPLNIGIMAQESPKDLVVDVVDRDGNVTLGINQYSMISMLWKATQEQNELFMKEIIELKKEIQNLKSNQ